MATLTHGKRIWGGDRGMLNATVNHRHQSRQRELPDRKARGNPGFHHRQLGRRALLLEPRLQLGGQGKLDILGSSDQFLHGGSLAS